MVVLPLRCPAFDLYFDLCLLLPPRLENIIQLPSMSDGRLKADRDFTSEVDKAIPEAQELAKVGYNMCSYLH